MTSLFQGSFSLFCHFFKGVFAIALSLFQGSFVGEVFVHVEVIYRKAAKSAKGWRIPESANQPSLFLLTCHLRWHQEYNRISRIYIRYIRLYSLFRVAVRLPKTTITGF